MRRDATKRSGRSWTTLVTGAAVLAALPAAAQIPDQFTNLQVLPKDMKKQQLVDTMRGFATGLGVRCDHCHAGEPTPDLSKMDFASDAKEAKKTARLMLQMVRGPDRSFAVATGQRLAPSPPPLPPILAVAIGVFRTLLLSDG